MIMYTFFLNLNCRNLKCHVTFKTLYTYTIGSFYNITNFLKLEIEFCY